MVGVIYAHYYVSPLEHSVLLLVLVVLLVYYFPYVSIIARKQSYTWCVCVDTPDSRVHLSKECWGEEQKFEFEKY